MERPVQILCLKKIASMSQAPLWRTERMLRKYFDTHLFIHACYSHMQLPPNFTYHHY